MNARFAASISLAVAAAILLTFESAEAQTRSLEGAWKVVSLRSTGADSATAVTVQPSLYIFTRRHYSMMRVTGNEPRAVPATDDFTDAESLAAFNSFIANTGTYEVVGRTLTIHPIVARVPNFSAGGSDKYQFRVKGDTLWLGNTGRDIRQMIGGKLVGPSGTPSGAMFVLVRQK